MPLVQLSHGPVEYTEVGSGPPLVFVHGAFANEQHWRKLVPLLGGRYRCILPTLPLGGHRVPVRPEADLTPPGLARLLGEFLDELELEGATLIGNDTGSALVQLVAVNHPQRVGSVVLVSGDVYEYFPPPIIRPLQFFARIPGFLFALGHAVLRLPPLQRLPFTYGWLAKRRHPQEIMRAYIGPPIADRNVRRDLKKVVAGFSPSHTLDAAARLRDFERPALIVWPTEDRLFPVEAGRRLAAAMPNARFEEVSDSYDFVPEDQPERLAELIAGFVGARAERAAA